MYFGGGYAGDWTLGLELNPQLKIKDFKDFFKFKIALLTGLLLSLIISGCIPVNFGSLSLDSDSNFLLVLNHFQLSPRLKSFCGSVYLTDSAFASKSLYKTDAITT